MSIIFGFGVRKPGLRQAAAWLPAHQTGYAPSGDAPWLCFRDSGVGEESTVNRRYSVAVEFYFLLSSGAICVESVERNAARFDPRL
jgi:hypothetical protein